MKWGVHKKKELDPETKHELLSQANTGLDTNIREAVELSRLATENPVEANKKAVELLEKHDPNFRNSADYIWKTYKKTSMVGAAIALLRDMNKHLYNRKEKLGYNR